MESYLKKKLDSRERNALIELAAKNFPLNYYDGCKHFRFMLDNMPGARFVLVKNSNELAGFICLLDREFNYYGIVLKLTGLSYMVTDPRFRDFSVTNLIKEEMFKYIANNSDLSMGFARKKMDGYWYPYGYLGFTNFGQLSADLALLPRMKSDFCVKRMTAKHIPRINELFNSTYKGLLGPLKRDASLWAYYLKKVDKEQLVFNIFCKGDRIAGYVIRKGNVIHEFGSEGASALNLLSLLRSEVEKERFSDGKIHFQIGHQHPLMFYLKRLPHTFTARYAWNGGHIVRITSLVDFLHKVIPALELRLKNALVQDFEFKCNGFQFQFKKGKLCITESHKPVSYLHDWEKMIFGVASVDDIVNIPDIKCREILKILFPVAAPQVPVLDQF